MKRILFIMDRVFPKATTNSKCVISVIEYLKKDYDITILSESSTLNAYNENGVCYEFYKRNNPQKIINILKKLLLKLISPFNTQKIGKSSIKKQVDKIFKEQEVGLVVTVSYPFLSLWCANYIKEKYNTIVVSYNLDILSYRLKSSLKKNIVRDYELKVYRKLDNNYFNESIGNKREFIDSVKQFKFGIIGIPIFSNMEIENNSNNNSNNNNSNNINVLYAGAFQKNIRRPNEMLDLITKLGKEGFIDTFRIISYGDYKKKILNFEKKSDNVHCDFDLDYSEVRDIKENYNVYINISNLDDTQIPSKIYEYMKERKIIINIYYLKSQKEIFREYPLVYHINAKEIKHLNIENLKDFIFKNLNKKISLKKTVSMFPEYTIEEVSSLIVNNIK